MSRPGAVVVGTGFGCRVHVPALRAAGFDVLALVGRDREKTARRAARLEIVHAFTSLADALALPGVDAVTIATPPHTHAMLVLDAVAAGKHVICEKPFALDAAEASAMLAAADRARICHLVGHEFRWAPDRALVGRALADGAIGEPRFASLVQFVHLVADPSTPVPDWWFDASRGGGWLGASGSHLVDTIRVWLGEFESVSASLPVVSVRTGAVAEDSFVVRFRLRGGAEGVVQQTAAAWAPASLCVVGGTTGTLGIDDGRVWLADSGGRRDLDAPAEFAVPETLFASADPRHRFTHLELGPYTRLCEVLLAGVERRPAAATVAPPTFVDGLACMQVLDAVRASAAAGGAVVRVDYQGVP